MIDVKQNRDKLPAFVFEKSGTLSAAGLALIAIAEMLGADGSDHDVSDTQRAGLHHAVFVIGEAMFVSSSEVAEAAELAGALDTQEVAK